jgi:hypothetical protein
LVRRERSGFATCVLPTSRKVGLFSACSSTHATDVFAILSFPQSRTRRTSMYPGQVERPTSTPVQRSNSTILTPSSARSRNITTTLQLSQAHLSLRKTSCRRRATSIRPCRHARSRQSSMDSCQQATATSLSTPLSWRVSRTKRPSDRHPFARWRSTTKAVPPPSRARRPRERWQPGLGTTGKGWRRHGQV